MATTLPAIMAAVNADVTAASDVLGIGRRGYAAYDLTDPPAIPLTAAQRATAVTAINGGTITDLASVTALIATATSGAVTSKHAWRIIAGYQDMTVG